MSEIVAIIGATGAQGGSVLTSLYSASDKYQLRAVTRNVDSARVKELRAQYPGVEWVAADNNDVESLRSAFKNVDIVFANTNYLQPEIFAKVDAGDLDAEFKQGKNIVDAAVAEGVNHFVYSSLESPSQGSNGKYSKAYESEGKQKIEQYVRSHSDKIKGYFVYAAFYFQNFLHAGIWSTNSNGEKTVTFGYPLPADARQPYVDIEVDFGNTVRGILDDRASYEGKTVKIAEGDYTGPEIAEAFTRATGIPADYVHYKVPELDRAEINEMLDYFVEFGSFSVPGFVDAKPASNTPFKTVDDFWQRYSAYRPEEH
ncbi:NAD(P)-binding protein [Linderina pennispora]|uniref:NAD(P)-binding protein n=1 Tax=Linderina pennispora TaxID=61395 RepID=A0A1Y1W1B3_9FUNG|nr:NAD(P)-binding protein [Linderina pennispora]ORX67272.1 NAD(P)-binding protein [Linderina pennispora]